MGKKEIGQILGGGLGGLIAQEPLAAISPLAGYLKYQGDKKDKAKERREREEAEEALEDERMNKIMSGDLGMKAGGRVRRKPIDGKAVRGRTKGRMI
mgnify:CR=1 FL=1